MEGQSNLETFRLRYKTLAFKYPSTFNEAITTALVSVFNRNDPKISFSVHELQDYYEDYYRKKNSRRGKYSKARNLDKSDIAESTYNNLSILHKEKIVYSYNVIYLDENKNLKEIEKYFLSENKESVQNKARESGSKAILDYLIYKMLTSKKSYKTLATEKSILGHFKKAYFEANNLLYTLTTESKIVSIPLVSQFGKNDTNHHYIEYLIPGKDSYEDVRLFLNDVLLPELARVYKEMDNKEKLDIPLISEYKITEGNKDKVIRLCLAIINRKHKRDTTITVEEYNIANLVIDVFIILGEDPLAMFNTIGEIDLDIDALSPFLTKYIHNFSSFAKSLKLMKNFMGHLPQLIEKHELIKFFEGKGFDKQMVENFLHHLPSNVISFNLFKKQYFIEKGQIVNSIKLITQGNGHKNTRLGRFQFELLARIFKYLEHTNKDITKFLEVLKVTSQEYKEAVFLLANDSYTYNKADAEVDKELKNLALLIEQSKAEDISSILKGLPSKTVYYPKDFKHINSERTKREVLKRLGLMSVVAKDTMHEYHTVYLRERDLSINDIKFINKKPNYKSLRMYFNI